MTATIHATNYLVLVEWDAGASRRRTHAERGYERRLALERYPFNN